MHLTVRITYLGADLNRHGGDWEELGREGQPVRMFANGVKVHDYLQPPKLTEVREFALPHEAILRAADVEKIILSFEPKTAAKVTYRYVPIPIAELWVLETKALNSAAKL